MSGVKQSEIFSPFGIIRNSVQKFRSAVLHSIFALRMILIMEINTYLWQRLPLLLMFANGYIIYRLLVITKLTHTFVYSILQKSRGSLYGLILSLIITAAFLSFFIPNAVTVLILIPVLKTIEQDIDLQNWGNSPDTHSQAKAWKREKTHLTTALTLAMIYGANIGGMGSLIGSPANLLLIGALDLYKIPGREQINFFNWFIWAVPLVTLFATSAFILLILSGVPKNIKKISPCLKKDIPRFSEDQKSGVCLLLLFVLFWIIEAIFKKLFSLFEIFEPLICFSFFIFFLWLTFVRPARLSRKPLLRYKEMITGFPVRGILFVCLLIGMIFIIRFFEADKAAADMILEMITRANSSLPFFTIMLLTTLSVIFLTEILSNTVVSTSFFPIAYFIADAYHLSPLILMIAVSAASTCAFMTPVATPCNALAFGEMKGISFPRMLISGFLLNIIGAFLMTIWLPFILPFVYY